MFYKLQALSLDFETCFFITLNEKRAHTRNKINVQKSNVQKLKQIMIVVADTNTIRAKKQ